MHFNAKLLQSTPTNRCDNKCSKFQTINVFYILSLYTKKWRYEFLKKTSECFDIFAFSAILWEGGKDIFLG